jgi:hypothetical protein
MGLNRCRFYQEERKLGIGVVHLQFVGFGFGWKKYFVNLVDNAPF